MRRITMVLVALAMVFFIANQSLAATGNVVDQFPVPDEIGQVFDNGIAWDGDNLWVPCRSPLGGYYLGPRQIDPETGELTGKALPNTRYSVAGIAFDRSKRILWHLAYPCGPIYGVNVDTGSTVRSFYPSACWLHDIAFDGRYLWVTKDNGTVYQFDPDTGQRVGSFVGPGGITNPYGEGPNLQGVTHDGRYFWFTRGAGDGSDNQRYYKVDPEIALRDGHSDNAIVNYFDLPFASTLASDGKYLWTSYYDSATGMKMIAKIDTGSLEPIEPEPIEPPAPGDLDITFNPPNGFVTYYGGTPGYALAVTPQKDGKIIVVGNTRGKVPVLRYNPDGSLDGGFGTGGVATYFGGYWNYGRAVALQADGKIVVAGLTYIGSNYDVLVLRYNPDGSLDGGFGTGGVATYYDGGNSDSGNAISLQTDGKIVVVGQTHNGRNCDVLLLRYNPDGSLDSGFGTNGVAIFDSGSWDEGYAVSLQADGKIVVAGFTTYQNGNVLVLRYNPDGSLDSGFGTDGVAIFDSGSWECGRAVALRTDGKIVVAGHTNNGRTFDVLLLRYNPDGSLDSDFGTDGVATYDSGSWDYGYAVALHTDGNIVVAGYTHNGTDYDVLVLTNNPDGSLDGDFGTNGVATFDTGNWDYGYAVALQADGNIVVAGQTHRGPPHGVLVLRLIGGGNEPIPASIDIEPDTLNTKSKGKWITCYIELSDGYSVEDIDFVTLTQVNSHPIDPPLVTLGPSEVGDHDDDGITDLMVKFDRQELIPLLEVGDAELTIAGELGDGTAVEGSDTIRVIRPGK